MSDMPAQAVVPETPLPPRDAQGHFIKKPGNPLEAVSSAVTATNPVATITKPPDPTLEKPLLSVTINNPFKKLLYWLNDIRKKQITTFDFKIKIPLIALPIFLLVLGSAFQFFFSLGKSAEKKELAQQPKPAPIVIVKPAAASPVMVSKVGVIRATYQIQALGEPTPLPSPLTPE